MVKKPYANNFCVILYKMMINVKDYIPCFTITYIFIFARAHTYVHMHTHKFELIQKIKRIRDNNMKK